MARPSKEPIRAAALPAGRHGLSRAFVVDDQRSRLLDATVVCAARDGFAGMSVEDVVHAAGVSRRTFYELFDNKLDAFLAAFDASASVLLSLVQYGYSRERTFERRVGAGLSAFLGGLSIAPEGARVCIVESLAAGPVAIERRLAVMSEFAHLIATDVSAPPAARALPASMPEALVGGIYEIVFSHLSRQRAAELPLLAPDLTEIVLQPFVGRRAAAIQATRMRQQVGASQTFAFATGLRSR